MVEGLCRNLVRSGDEVDLFTMRFDGLPREEHIDGLHVHRVPCIRRRKHYCTVPEVATYLAMAFGTEVRQAIQRRPDLVHAHFIFPDGLLAWCVAAVVGVPFVITAHGTDVPGYNPKRVQLTHKLLAPLWRRVVGSAAEIVCPSDSLLQLTAEHGPGARLSVIPNGVDPDRFRLVPKQPRILVVTRLLERKGIQFLIQALQQISLDWEVNIVGDGPYLPALLKLARTTKTPVRFRGWMDNDSAELRELYETSSVFVLPSESENFPICLLEAMAASHSIITTRDTGCAEVVGSAAWLVDPRDPEGIQDALLTLTNDAGRRNALGQKARNRVQNNFSWSAVAQQYRALYRRHVDVGS